MQCPHGSFLRADTCTSVKSDGFCGRLRRIYVAFVEKQKKYRKYLQKYAKIYCISNLNVLQYFHFLWVGGYYALHGESGLCKKAYAFLLYRFYLYSMMVLCILLFIAKADVSPKR